MVDSWVLFFDQIRAGDLPRVGGKAANLGELTAVGLPVPPGFCVTADAFRHFMAEAAREQAPYALLEDLSPKDIARVRRAGAALRALLARVPLPEEVAQAVVDAGQRLGRGHAYAVRSSATAEDLPHASFAGQHETYLNVRGRDALLEKVKACFISLFTDRAILYRLQNGFDHRQAALAVVVQRMVFSEVSGILFTADPVSGNRNILTINPGFGLGEALVSGLVTPDLYQVHKLTGRIIKREIADKRLVILPKEAGGTEQMELPEEQRTRPALTDEQILELARLGQQIEDHFGSPQDVEWAWNREGFYILQSRPITTLYPLPEPLPEDNTLHVYLSLAHQQGMTRPMPPLSISVLRILLPVGRRPGCLESVVIASAGGRLYADLSPLLSHPIGRRILLRAMDQIEPLAKYPLSVVAERPEFRAKGERFNPLCMLPRVLPYLPRILRALFWAPTDGIHEQAMTCIDRYISRPQARLQATEDVQERLRIAVDEIRTVLVRFLSDPESWVPHLAAGLMATAMLHRVLRSRVEEQVLVALGRGLEGNIETQMDLAVGDLADIVRRSPQLLAHLEREDLDAATRIAQAAALPGGEVFLEAWQRFQARFGARCPAEIDVSQPRWQEDSTSLLRMVLNAARSDALGSHRQRFQRLVAEADRAAHVAEKAVAGGVLGSLHARLVRRLIQVSRSGMALRGYHKYLVVRVLTLVKSVFREAGAHLARRGQLAAEEDVWFLTLPEILEGMQNPGRVFLEAVPARRQALEHYATLNPPPVITSEGEVPPVHPQVIATGEGGAGG